MATNPNADAGRTYSDAMRSNFEHYKQNRGLFAHDQLLRDFEQLLADNDQLRAERDAARAEIIGLNEQYKIQDHLNDAVLNLLEFVVKHNNEGPVGFNLEDADLQAIHELLKIRTFRRESEE